MPLLLAALFIGVPIAVLSWRRFSYRLAGSRLELRSGVFSRSVRTIPLERVRGVDVSQPFLHRLLGLARVEVEAAAGGDSSSAELSLPAVSLAEAERLREALLGMAFVEGDEPEQAKPVYQATPGLLALGGITSMRYLLAPAVVVGVVFDLAEDLPGGLVERTTDAARDQAPTDPVGIGALALAGIAIVVLAAAAGSLLVDWNFTLTDQGEQLTAVRGLLTRRVVSLDQERVRGLDVRDTPARRALQLVSVTAIAAGLRGRTGGTTLAPVLPAAEAAILIRTIDPSSPDLLARLTPHPLAARSRRLTRALALPLLLLVLTVAPSPLVGDCRRRAPPAAHGAARARPLPPARPPLRRAPGRSSRGQPPTALVGTRPTGGGRFRSPQLPRPAASATLHPHHPPRRRRWLTASVRPRRAPSRRPPRSTLPTPAQTTAHPAGRRSMRPALHPGGGSPASTASPARSISRRDLRT